MCMQESRARFLTQKQNKSQSGTDDIRQQQQIAASSSYNDGDTTQHRYLTCYPVNARAFDFSVTKTIIIR